MSFIGKTDLNGANLLEEEPDQFRSRVSGASSRDLPRRRREL